MYKTIKTLALAGAVMASMVAIGSSRLSGASEDDVIVPPYEEDWKTEGIFDRYTVVDGNEDNRTWTFSNGQVRYHYSSVNAADDWLLTPEILMESGKVYEFLATAFAVSDSYTERIEICLGQGVDPASFTQVVVPPTDLEGSTPQELPATFTVSEGGYYRIGFHAISDKNHFFLTLQGWSLKVLVESGAPTAVTDLQVVPGEKGARTATLSFIAPTTMVAGDPLTELDRIEVYGNGRLLTTIDHPVPGEAQKVDVTLEEDGMYDFEVVGCNSSGVGISAHASAYIGSDVPVVAGAVGCFDLRDGKMSCSWSAAGEVGEHGGYVDSTAVEYRLYSLDASGKRGEMLASTTDTCCVADYSSFDNDIARILEVEMVPVCAEKEGSAIGGRLILGKPTQLPYRQSFGTSSKDVFWWQEAQGGRWLSSQQTADGDGACLRFVADDSIARGKACSEKLTLVGAARPMLLFQHSTKPGQNIRLHVLADRQDANGPVLLKTIFPDDEKSEAWVQEGIDLGEFLEDDYLVLTFIVEADEKDAVCRIDDIQVRDVPDCDLELVSVQLPNQVKVGHEELAVVTVRNNGLMSVGEDAYALELIVGDSTVTACAQVLELAPFSGTATYTFTFTPTIFDQVVIEVGAKVSCPEDIDEDNNVAKAVASVKQPSVARMVNLTAEACGSDVSLAWSLPNGSLDVGNIITEDFEDTETFANLSAGGITADNHWGELGSWKLYDGNGTPVRVVELCDSDSIGSPKAFQVFNAFESGLDMTDYDVVESMASYSGEQMLLAMTPADGQPSDKWLVSPLLSGTEQTISLFVSATANDPGTTFEVLYTTSNTPEDLEQYRLLHEGVASTMDWNEVRLDLPVGARYFAIRSTASGTAGFMVDDITFTASPVMQMPKARPVLTGCHVYRDQLLIAQLDASTVEYVDNEVENGQHTYYVTAVYGETESALSNPAIVNVGATAIPEVPASATRFGDDIMVYDLRGVLLGHGRDCFSSQPRGVYVVKDRQTGRVARVAKK